MVSIVLSLLAIVYSTANAEAPRLSDTALAVIDVALAEQNSESERLKCTDPFKPAFGTEMNLRFSEFDAVLDRMRTFSINADPVNYRLQALRIKESVDRISRILGDCPSCQPDGAVEKYVWEHNSLSTLFLRMRSLKLKPDAQREKKMKSDAAILARGLGHDLAALSDAFEDDEVPLTLKEPLKAILDKASLVYVPLAGHAERDFRLAEIEAETEVAAAELRNAARNAENFYRAEMATAQALVERRTECPKIGQRQVRLIALKRNPTPELLAIDAKARDAEAMRKFFETKKQESERRIEVQSNKIRGLVAN